MSNPWTYSPRDIALAPLYRTLKNIEDPSDVSSVAQVSIANTNAKNNTPFQDASVGRKRSTLIEKLRQADVVNQRRRNDPSIHGISPENAKIITFARKLTKIFVIVSRSLEQFQKADVLKTAYLQAFLSNQLLWDDISYENKQRLIHTSRHLLEQLLQLLQNQESVSRHNSFAQCVTELQEVMERTEIMRDDTQADDVALEDLFEVLSQCMATLEVIKLTHQPMTLHSDSADDHSAY